MRRLTTPLVPILACATVGCSHLPADETDETIGQIRLHWQIDSAEDNYGFYLMRGESEDGPWVRVNERLIPGVGTTADIATFEHFDEGLERGRDYWYELHEVGYNGGESLMGTIRAHCRTVEEDVVHERRTALGREVRDLDDALESPLVRDEWVVFLHRRAPEQVHLIGDWTGWWDNPIEVKRLQGTQLLAAEIPRSEFVQGEAHAYAFVIGELASREVVADALNSQGTASSEAIGHDVSQFRLGE